MKTRKGFTLIEIMVAVGIMLILTTVMTVSAVTYIQKTNVAKQKIALHQDKFDVARAQVDGLLGSAGVITAAPTTEPPTPEPPTTEPPTPEPPTPEPPTPTATPTATPTPTPTPSTPTPYPGTTVGAPEDISGWGQVYNYRSSLTYPSSNQAEYLTLYIPTGAVLYFDWGATIVSQSGNTAVLKVPANSSSASVFVKYADGTPVMAITIVSKKAP